MEDSGGRRSCPHPALRLSFRNPAFTGKRIMNICPPLLITMGDVAGIGPEVIARAWPQLVALCRPVVVGDPSWLERALALVGSPARVVRVRGQAAREPTADVVPCLHGSEERLGGVEVGKVSAA